MFQPLLNVELLQIQTRITDLRVTATLLREDIRRVNGKSPDGFQAQSNIPAGP